MVIPMKRFISLCSIILLTPLFYVFAQTSGTCATGKAEQYLDINNVRARLMNTGGLFWNGDPNVYTVPKNGTASAIFAHGLWLSGYTETDELRVAAASFSTWEFWPGPLDAQANPPADCSSFDRLYKISRSDIEDYNTAKVASKDLSEWPWQLGAPVKDGDGNPNNYDLSKGDRPDLLGDQMVWWVMNDVGNVHKRTNSKPLGVEVHVLAYAFDQPGALGNTTFYRYTIVNKSKNRYKDFLASWFSDFDLGSPSDDSIGTDTTRSLVYIYNTDNVDEGDYFGYGDSPPALGYLLLKNSTSRDHYGRFGYTYAILKSTDCGEPNTDAMHYRYAQIARCRDGRPATLYGLADYNNLYPPESGPITKFTLPGNPITGEGWSARNYSGKGDLKPNSDWRVAMTTRPIVFEPGTSFTMDWAINWSRGDNHLASLQKLWIESDMIQKFFDNGYEGLVAPDAPTTLTANYTDGKIFLSWDWDETSNNYFDSYKSSFGYNLEGYVVRSYASDDDTEGEILAVFDIKNDISEVIDVNSNNPALTYLAVKGINNGLSKHFVVESVTGLENRYFGVQAYAVAKASPKIIWGKEKRIEIVPIQINTQGKTPKPKTSVGQTLLAVSKGVITEGKLFGRVVDPVAIQDDVFHARFYKKISKSGEDVLLFDLINTKKGNEVIFDGYKYFERFGTTPPIGQSFAVKNGLEFYLEAPPLSFKSFSVVANGAGPLAIPEMGAFAFNASGFPCLGPNGEADPTCRMAGTRDRPAIALQQKTTGRGLGWGLHTFSNSTAAAGTSSNGTRAGYAAFINRVSRDGARWPVIVPYDFEIRFKGTTSLGYNGFGNTAEQLFYDVPFELWQIGSNTPNNTADDIRMIPYMLSNGPNGGGNTAVPGRADNSKFDLSGADHEISGGADDPYTDAFYFYAPKNKAFGDAGYKEYETAGKGGTLAGSDYEVMAHLVLMNWNGGTAPPYDRELPEVGTVFRITTTKPLVDGVVFELDTSQFAPQLYNLNTKDVGIVPNPYKAGSLYETWDREEVRFTNVPMGSTIRVFSLDGVLVRKLQQSSEQGFLPWDLRNEGGRILASGMYLIHIEIPGVGERVLKFGAVMRAK